MSLIEDAKNKNPDAFEQLIQPQLQRMYRVRNKFMHHAEIDKKIEPLYKHLLVYTWECIREMSYVSKSRGIKSLEELYAYFRMNYNILHSMPLFIG